MKLRISRAESGVVHHLFRVMRPAFGKSVADEYLTELRLRAVRMQELKKVSGVSLVDGSEEKAPFAGKIIVLFLFRPRRIRR